MILASQIQELLQLGNKMLILVVPGKVFHILDHGRSAKVHPENADSGKKKNRHSASEPPKFSEREGTKCGVSIFWTLSSLGSGFQWNDGLASRGNPARP